MSPSTPARSRTRIPVQLNPFGDSALGSPWNEIPADVPSINDAAFRAVLSELDQVRRGGKASIVITGEPGSGKTHLLGRLRKIIGPETAYIYVRCNASAATLWRHLRAALATDLLKRDGGEPSRLQRVLQQNPNQLDQIDGFSLRRVLSCYGDGRHVHAASAWLRGETLPPSDLDALGIGAERDDEDRSRESEAKDIVTGLLDFLAPDPTVLCFDQVEALETYRGDKDGFHTMGTLIAQLIDDHHHLLLVSCIISAFEDHLDQLTNRANRDRWLRTKITLRPINWDDALKLVAGRLDSSPDLAPQRREQHPQDPLWPVNPQTIKPLFEATGLCLPRTLIQACKTHFESLFTDEADPRPKLSREDFLQQEYEKNVNVARTIVTRQGGDKVLTESLPWLFPTAGFSTLAADAGHSRYANLAFQKENRAFAVSLCCCRGNELTGRLRRIERYWQPGNLGLKIVRDPSVKPGVRGEQLLGVIKSRGGQEVNPLPEALAALQAIHNMITAARSGDLTQDGEEIGEAEVTQWALANLPPQVENLRADLVGADPPDPALAKLAALIGERKVVAAEAAARELSMTMEEVSACARRNPMRFGLLAGPPMVLFQAIEGSAPETSHA